MTESVCKSFFATLYKRGENHYNRIDMYRERGLHGMKLRLQKWDLAAIAGILLVAVVLFCLFLPRESGACAEVYQDGRLVRRVFLSEDQEFTVTGKYTNTVTVRNGKIAVTASDCPGGDCVGCGWQKNAGKSIVCLPNALEIRVTSGGEVDFVVG